MVVEKDTLPRLNYEILILGLQTGQTGRERKINNEIAKISSLLGCSVNPLTETQTLMELYFPVKWLCVEVDALSEHW